MGHVRLLIAFRSDLLVDLLVLLFSIADLLFYFFFFKHDLSLLVIVPYMRRHVSICVRRTVWCHVRLFIFFVFISFRFVVGFSYIFFDVDICGGVNFVNVIHYHAFNHSMESKRDAVKSNDWRVTKREIIFKTKTSNKMTTHTYESTPIRSHAYMNNKNRKILSGKKRDSI